MGTQKLNWEFLHIVGLEPSSGEGQPHSKFVCSHGGFQSKIMSAAHGCLNMQKCVTSSPNCEALKNKEKS